MSAKKIISFIVLIIIILLLVFGIFYFLNNKQEPVGNNDTDNSLPIGGSSGNNGGGNSGNTGGEGNIILQPGEIFDIDGGIVNKQDARLRQISIEPISGGSISQKLTITEEVVVSEEEGVDDEIIEVEGVEYITYFVQKKNGHILKDSDLEEEQIKLLNKTIPQTEMSIVNEDFAIIQYLDSAKEVINSFAGIFKEEEIVGEDEIIETNTIFDGSVFPSNMESITFSPSTSQLAFLSSNIISTNVVVVDLESNLEDFTVVYTTPLLDISLEWGSDDYLYLTSKADSRAKGFVKKINPRTGEDETVISGIYGLTSNVSPDGEYMIISNSLNNNSALYLYDTGTGLISNLSLYTLPEKCVWSKENTSIAYCAGQRFASEGNYPQDWYQGKVSFADILWRIDLEDLAVEEFYTFPGIEKTFDIISPQLSPDEKRLFFIDKNDSTPWVLRLD